MNIWWKVGIGVLLLLGSYGAGRYVQSRNDKDAAMVQDAKDTKTWIASDIADQAKVKSIDGIMINNDTHFTTVLSINKANSATNVKAQTDAISANPSLLACPLPADVVSLREQQRQASAAIAAEADSP